jgi:hypothetical protein
MNSHGENTRHKELQVTFKQVMYLRALRNEISKEGNQYIFGVLERAQRCIFQNTANADPEEKAKFLQSMIYALMADEKLQSAWQSKETNQIILNTSTETIPFTMRDHDYEPPFL